MRASPAPRRALTLAAAPEPASSVASSARNRLSLPHSIVPGRVHAGAVLRGYGAEDSIAVNAASEGDFCSFIGTMPSARKARLVLTDNGNLRAV